ncbi:uncharacterized protein [Henckelia pumila]|uniref:uncharacterized protein n=1 Tax=Henckelia pumila TaxID=405737 RepID=UPI003C6DF8A6
MQAFMNDELQRRFEGVKHATDIHLHLKELIDEQTRPLRHATVKELITFRMRYGVSVHEHGVRMIGLVEKLVGMDLVLPTELTMDVLLLSLPISFDSFVVNFNMNNMEPTLEELKRPCGKGKKRSIPPPKKNVPLKRQDLSPVVALQEAWTLEA